MHATVLPQRHTTNALRLTIFILVLLAIAMGVSAEAGFAPPL